MRLITADRQIPMDEGINEMKLIKVEMSQNKYVKF